MEEKEQNTDIPCSQNDTTNLQAQNEKLTMELERAKKKQKIFNIIVGVMAVILVGGILLVFWVYKKVNEYKPVIETMTQMARQTSDFMQANKIQSEMRSIAWSTSSLYSQSGFAGSSLSMIGSIQDSAAIAAVAAQDSQSSQEMAEVVDEYKENPQVKEMLDEFKKDPQLGKIFEDYQSDPSQVMRKMNDPAIMKTIMDKMAKNPRFMATMMKMASDPRVMKAVSKQRNIQINENSESSH